jgi:hypothetical protein
MQFRQNQRQNLEKTSSVLERKTTESEDRYSQAEFIGMYPLDLSIELSLE